MFRARIVRTAACLLAVVASSLAQEQPIEVPFETERNLIFVQVKLNGRGPYTMMVDTGTDPSAIDIAAAKELGLEPKATGENAVGGGTEKNAIYEVKPVDVTLGELKAENVEIAAGDLSNIAKAIGKPMHGVLGHSFLDKRIVQIDFPARRLRFYTKAPADQAAPGVERATLPFEYAHDSILVKDVAVNGRQVTTLFDTGFNGAFNVMPAAIPQLGLQEAFDKATPKKAIGFSGAATSREGTVPDVKIGSLTVESPSVIFWEKGTGHDTTSWGFTIGNGFLKDFLVTLDYPAKRITLERPQP